ncbi:MAG: glycosyltransferase, partial [Chloroflexi bacterium]
IILSDDCSTDRTFEIMEEMARAYEGPHRVVVRRHLQNLGLIRHVNVVLSSARSDIIVLAAGDDISLPHRTSRVTYAFLTSPSTVLVHSNAYDLHAVSQANAILTPPFRSKIDLYAAARSASIYIGATGAIHKSLYCKFGLIDETKTYEDLVLGFRAILLSGLQYINESLVEYRTGVGISSRHKCSGKIKRAQRIRQQEHLLATFRQRLHDIEKIDHPDSTLRTILRKEISCCESRLDFHRSTLRFLATCLLEPRYSCLKALSSETKYMLGFVQ